MNIANMKSHFPAVWNHAEYSIPLPAVYFRYLQFSVCIQFSQQQCLLLCINSFFYVYAFNKLLATAPRILNEVWTAVLQKWLNYLSLMKMECELLNQRGISKYRRALF